MDMNRDFDNKSMVRTEDLVREEEGDGKEEADCM